MPEGYILKELLKLILSALISELTDEMIQWLKKKYAEWRDFKKREKEIWEAEYAQTREDILREIVRIQNASVGEEKYSDFDPLKVAELLDIPRHKIPEKLTNEELIAIIETQVSRKRRKKRK